MYGKVLAENLPRVLEAIGRAAARAGRGEDQVTLVAITKAHPPDALRAAIAAGIRNLGENRLEELEEKDARASLGGMLKVLTPREREIMKLRYGLGGARQKTLEDIGEKFGITRERIRQIQMGALKKLRREMGRQEAVAVPH